MNDEKQIVEQSAAVSRMMADVLQQHERENKWLWTAVIVLALAFCVMAGCMVWTVQNAQRVANEAMLNALNTVAEMEVTTTETTTTEVTQDTGEGNGNNIYQQEGGTYNESGAE